MKARLKKDIVIKAGTVFSSAPMRQEHGRGTLSHLFGLTDDTYGELLYAVGNSHGDLEDEALAPWFEVLEEKEEPPSNWTCPRCGSRHSSTETRCWCETEDNDD